MDKQIIIDGVDVSGCKHFKNTTCIADYLLTDMNFSEAKCELCKNCYYKQLKRKEQALDEIEKYLDAQQKYFDSEDYHNLLDIINKAKEEINEES